ncbi:hypothetical protein [Bacteroides sp.]|uniref:hypothetical protein n=1 Tax=Bacteroides sp. TaxID=29523 RepID=UPI0026312E03|nr:hypothetical protein [Bacteroides sp.]MDD3037159.1 hypothetical protein [Bacteroides sp.]
MGSIQSMILGESNKDEPIVVPPMTKEEVKHVGQPANKTNSAPNDLAIDEHSSDGVKNNGQVQNKESQVTQHSIVGQQPPKQYGSMGDVADEMYKKRMPTEEELAKERKREKSRQIISAIADGVSAISNLYFTGKGANNVEQTSMSAANTRRYQEILDRRRRMQEKWDDARLAVYDRDRLFNYHKDRDDANWNRTSEWHDSQVRTDNERYKDTKERNKVLDEFNMADRDRNYKLSEKAQKDQERAQKDASSRGWAAVDTQEKRIKAQEDKQKAYSQYQFEKINGSPEPKRINSARSIYVGRNTWEQNAGQLAGEIIKDIEASNPALAKQLSKQLNGLNGKKGADAKQTAAIVDKYIMSSPRAQQLAIELEKDYKKRYELATNESLPQEEDDPYAKYTTGDDPYAKYAE